MSQPSSQPKVVKCLICGKECNGREAEKHMKETGHNSWTLIYEEVK